MSRSSNSKSIVPEAREALNRFKMEAASEVGVNLKQGYNGDLTSREAGSVGGQMVKKIYPIRTLEFERHNRISKGHKITVRYAFSLTVQYVRPVSKYISVAVSGCVIMLYIERSVVLITCVFSAKLYE